MTKAMRDELRRLASTECLAPWRIAPYDSNTVLDRYNKATVTAIDSDDAHRIVAVCNALPALLDALDAAESRVAELESTLRDASEELNGSMNAGDRFKLADRIDAALTKDH